MGLSIHYSGSFNLETSLSEMIDEVKDIAIVQKWENHIFETKFPDDNRSGKNLTEKIYGICITPPGSEPVWLSFVSDGRMCNPFMYERFLKSKSKDDEEFSFLNFTKTQYAGFEIHKIIILLLRYISKKYLNNFSLIDEGYFWETNDEKLLEERFKLYNDMVNSLSDALENGVLKKGETTEEYLERIITEIHARKNK